LHNSSGSNNVANGANALSANTTGSENTALGVAALGNCTSDSQLVAVGYQALQNDNAAGGFNYGWNTAVGYQALQLNSSGFQNTALGFQALNSNVSGYNNVALGFAAGNAITGNNNIDIGNLGVGSDSGIIRIGTPGTQSQTYLAGTVNCSAITSSGNIIGGTIFSDGTIISVGNMTSFGNITSDGTITSSGLISGGTITSSGSISGASITSSGSVSGASITSSGSVSGTSITSSGSISGASITSSGSVTCGSITITGGSDLAEPFAISAAGQPVSAGEVVVIDEANPGQLKLTDRPYDTRVAGVVSGANGIHPGIQMHQEGRLEGGKNVALSGRVYVQADTSNGAIKPGDLLTTSSMPGRAMKVTDHARAAGAILGKAMTGLVEGKGMVLVLVTLQ
jgi:hypothetical protein